MRIIYIEDNMANVALIERICHMNDDELVTFDDPETALEQVTPGAADLILMDLHLGNRSIDGLQLTSLLRQKGVQEPIIAITAYDTMATPTNILLRDATGMCANRFLCEACSTSLTPIAVETHPPPEFISTGWLRAFVAIPLIAPFSLSPIKSTPILTTETTNLPIFIGDSNAISTPVYSIFYDLCRSVFVTIACDCTR